MDSNNVFMTKTAGLPEASSPPGGTFTYKVQFPDPGLYWYHPHIREDDLAGPLEGSG